MSAGSELPPAPEAAAPAPPPPVDVNPIERFVGAITAPTRTFQSIAAKPDVAVPLIVYVVLSFVTTMLMMPHLEFEHAIREQLETTQPHVKGDNLDAAVRFTAAVSKAFVYFIPVLSPLIYLVIAGVLLLAFRILTGEGTFKQALSIVLYAWVPLTIKGIVMLVMIMSRGEVAFDQIGGLVMSNLGALVHPKQQMVLYALLSSLDLFAIWTLVLLSIGFSYMARVSKAYAAAIVFSVWAIAVALKVGFAALGASRLPKS